MRLPLTSPASPLYLTLSSIYPTGSIFSFIYLPHPIFFSPVSPRIPPLPETPSPPRHPPDMAQANSCGQWPTTSGLNHVMLDISICVGIDSYVYGLCAVSTEPTLEAQNFIVRPAVVTLLRGLYLWNRKPD